MSALTIELEPSLVAGLDNLAKRFSDSPVHLAHEAIKQFVALNDWQILETEAALREADEGNFATQEEVKMVFDRWS
jgi:predicted transcriptional regulator